MVPVDLAAEVPVWTGDDGQVARGAQVLVSFRALLVSFRALLASLRHQGECDIRMLYLPKQVLSQEGGLELLWHYMFMRIGRLV